MTDLALLLWAIIPPLLLLGYYYYRVPLAPPAFPLLFFWLVGAISGFIALSLEWAVEWVVNWQQSQYSLPGIALRQLVEIGPIEEGCKLVAVVAPTSYLQRRYRLRPSSIFLFTIAVALGFAAQENWIYLYNGTASIIDRTIGTPVHAMLSAPWGYALGIYISSTIRLHGDKKFMVWAWMNSVIFHALVNVLSSAWRYTPPLQFLSYGFFPLLLWMFWRWSQLLRRVQGKPPITLISSYTPQYRYYQRGLVLFALLLGGNAIFGLFLLVRQISPVRPILLLDHDIMWFIISRFLLNFIFGVLAWLIYRYLRHSRQREYF